MATYMIVYATIYAKNLHILAGKEVIQYTFCNKLLKKRLFLHFLAFICKKSVRKRPFCVIFSHRMAFFSLNWLILTDFGSSRRIYEKIPLSRYFFTRFRS